jgi:APA family basic amino acid/polyamine antiporter
MAQSSPPTLKRMLTLPAVTISGVGVILGAGIYALIGEAAMTAGNALWASFIFSALIASFTGLSYMELSSLFPEASAEFEYTRHPFGDLPAFVIGMMVTLSGIVGAATVAFGFAGYLNGVTGIPIVVAAFLLILGILAVLLTGIKQSAAVAIAFTLIEAAGLVGIILIGLPYLGSVNYLEAPGGISGIFVAAAIIFFAYQGFEEIVKLSDEAIEPEHTIPKALILALIITITLYILVSISIVSIAGWEVIAGSPNPFAMVAAGVFPSGYLLFTVIALFATANTALLMLLSSSRIIYGMAKKGRIPAILGWVHPRQRTPWAAIALVVILSLLFLTLGNIRDVALIANFTLFVTFAVINAAVIALRFTDPLARRLYRVPGTVGKIPIPALLGILTCLFFLLQIGTEILLIGMGLVIVSFAIGWLTRPRESQAE